MKEMEYRLALKKYGSQLWTRERAREARVELTKFLETAESGETVVIDTKGVEVFDYSYANELFGKTLLSLPHEYSGRFLVVENLTTYTRENLSKALEALNLAMIERKGKQLELIGKAHLADRETFDAIVKVKDPVSATTLKDQLSINLTAMNERLSKLTGLGLIRREKGASAAGREQYLYSVLK